MDTQAIATYIKENHLFNKNNRILVGFSGGADSVALTHILHSLGYTVVAAHCNFHLRDEESNRDETFVRQFCKQFDIELAITNFDTIQHATDMKISIEMAARELRYNWFEEMRVKHKCACIAIAHHRDDNNETLLLNLIRGTGIKGLTGIQPINGNIRRPLLQISRNDIIQYIENNKLSYVTDSTNLENDFARNKVRLDILPLMEQINQACSENLQRTIGYLNEAHNIYKQSIEESKKRIFLKNKVSIPLLLNEVAPKTLLFEICSTFGFNSSQIDDIFKSCSNTASKIFYSKSHGLSKSQGELYFYPIESNLDNTSKPKLEVTTVKNDSLFKLIKKNNIAYFDADLVDCKNLNLRIWQIGDYFVPFGMNGRKNISDFYNDLKLAEFEKQKQWLLTHNEDIIWVIGKRSDNRFRINKNTENILIISVID